MIVGPELRRELELASAELSQSGSELLRQMRAAHIGDDGMLEDKP